jgi:hypothetical protein
MNRRNWMVRAAQSVAGLLGLLAAPTAAAAIDPWSKDLPDTTIKLSRMIWSGGSAVEWCKVAWRDLMPGDTVQSSDGEYFRVGPRGYMGVTHEGAEYCDVDKQLHGHTAAFMSFLIDSSEKACPRSL